MSASSYIKSIFEINRDNLRGALRTDIIILVLKLFNCLLIIIVNR